MKWLVASVKNFGNGGANRFHHTGNSAVRRVDSKCERKKQNCNQYGQRFSAHIENSRSCTLLSMTQGVFDSAGAGWCCGGSVIASTLLLSTKETRPLRLYQTPCASSQAASASTEVPSFILIMARSPLLIVLLPVAIGPLFSAAGGAVGAAAGACVELAVASGLAVSDGLGSSTGWLAKGATAT